MKRAITALALVGALLLSVVACQVYNPTNNETIYTAMRSEGATSWADYSKEFEEADQKGKFDMLSEFEAFRKLYKEQATWEKLTVAYEKTEKAVEDAEKAVEDAEKIKKEAGDDATEDQKKAVEDAKEALIAAKGVMEEAHKIVVYCTLADLKALWDKEYKVLWDWNSKM